MSARILIRAILLLSGGAGALAAKAKPSSDFLYVWTAWLDTTQPDFLAVFDVRPASPRYGRLVTTVPVPGLKNRPHHTEHEIPANGRLFANGFGSGHTFIFDTKDPAHPRLDGEFADLAGMMHAPQFPAPAQWQRARHVSDAARFSGSRAWRPRRADKVFR